MSAMYFRPVVTYPTRCVAPAFFTRPAPVAHHIVPLFSLLDDSLTQLDNHLRQAQRQFKRPFNPKFDVKEDKEAYSVQGELPGFDAKDISIEFLDDGHTLQIKGKTVKETKNENTPATKAVEGATETSEKAIADAHATETPAEKAEASTSETSSLKSHQATVEDDVEEPANASATTTTTAAATEQAVAETPKAAEQQVTEQPKKTEEPETKNWVSERYTGSFTRSFRFPSKVDQEAVRASLKDGILAITLPFARKPESRKIQIE